MHYSLAPNPKKLATFALLFALWIPSIQAQEPVKRVPDALSWGTALLGPTVAVIKAFQSDQKGCELKRLALTGGIALGGAQLMQHTITSPRPCCPGNGFPSSHVAVSFIGLSHTWKWGGAPATIVLRPLANRHTWAQSFAGGGLGVTAELLGSLISCG